MMVEWLFLAVPWSCLLSVNVVFPDHTHLLFYGHKTFKGAIHRSDYASALVICSCPGRVYSNCKIRALTARGLPC